MQLEKKQNKNRMKVYNLLKFTAIVLFLVFQSCVSKKQILYMQDADVYDGSELSYPNITLQPNDILKISVGALIPETALPYNRITGNSMQANSIDIMKLDGYLVSSEQTITFPILGVLSVKNKTATQLEQDLRRQLEEGDHLVDPTVTIRLLNAKVTLLGEVNNPGTYTFTEASVTLLQALGYAGDLTINGKRDDVVLIREVDGLRTIAHLDLRAGNWLDTPYHVIQPNDVIIVNPNQTKVKSAGFVGNAATVLAICSVLLSTAVLLTR